MKIQKQKQAANAEAARVSSAADAATSTRPATASAEPTTVTRNQMHPVKYNYADSFACTYIVSVISAANAELVTYPLDLTKTRLQIQGEAASSAYHADKSNKPPISQTRYRGMLATAVGIAREEGVFKLWQGMTPALYRHVVYSGVRICVYDFLRKELAKNENNKNVSLPMYKSAFCGVFAGGFAQWLASPADLVKVQIQMEGKRRLMGEPARVHGAAHAFKDILRKGGIKGLWKGSIPNVQRACLVNLGDLSAYDVSKHMLMDKLNMPDSHTVHVLASICAGFVAAIMGTPADVVKTRVMNQPTDHKGSGLLYKGSMDCLRQTVNKEGFTALYKGFLPCWIRLAPWALTFWLSFEHIRAMLGASTY